MPHKNSTLNVIHSKGRPTFNVDLPLGWITFDVEFFWGMIGRPADPKFEKNRKNEQISSRR